MTAVEQLLIDGERVPAAEGRTFETVNPATGEVFRTVAEAGPEDADRAVRRRSARSRTGARGRRSSARRCSTAGPT